MSRDMVALRGVCPPFDKYDVPSICTNIKLVSTMHSSNLSYQIEEDFPHSAAVIYLTDFKRRRHAAKCSVEDQVELLPWNSTYARESF